MLIDFKQYSSSAKNQGHGKRGEIWMSLITCGSIHEGHIFMNCLVMTLEEDKRFLCVWLFYYMYIMWAILPIRKKLWRYQDIDQVLLHEIILFFLSIQLKCLAKLLPFGVNCRLQLASLGKKREETVPEPTCFMSKATLVPLPCEHREKPTARRVRYHRHHRQISHSILRPLRR